VSAYLYLLSVGLDDQPDVVTEEINGQVRLRIISTANQQLVLIADCELLIQLGQDIFNAGLHHRELERQRRVEAQVAAAADSE
jgi:hypothetical protein